MKDSSCSCRFLLAVASSAIAMASTGATLFWKPSVGGDIAIPGNWDAVAIAETDGLAVNKTGAFAFTMSADVTCDRFVPWANNLTWTLDFSGHT